MSPSKMIMFLEGNEKIITPEKSGWGVGMFHGVCIRQNFRTEKIYRRVGGVNVFAEVADKTIQV